MSAFVSRLMLRPAAGRRRLREQEVFVALQEFLLGLKHITINGNIRGWIRRTEDKSHAYRRAYTREQSLAEVPGSVVEWGLYAGLVTLLLGLRMSGTASVLAALPVLTAFVYSFQRIMVSATVLAQFPGQLHVLLPDCHWLYDFIHAAPVRKDGFRDAPRFSHAIEFRNVDFGYGPEAVLSKFNLTIRKNECVALVGASGAGKTTIINLLLGLYRPQGGEILIDGVPLSEIKLESWYGVAGFVGQDLFAFNGSVLENVTLLRTSSEAELHRALCIAQADFVQQLPQGIHTSVGERGLQISGGELQRLNIAAAILGDRPILVLDEATSALDNASERRFRAALEQLMEDHTVVVVAHRLSTVERADRIVVLEGGRAVEMGRHNELLERRGAYARLYGTLA